MAGYKQQVYSKIVDRTSNAGGYSGGDSAGGFNNPGLWYHKMVEIELFNNSKTNLIRLQQKEVE